MSEPGFTGLQDFAMRHKNPVRVKPTLFPVRETISIEKRCAAAGPKPRMGFHMMNHLRRFVDVFRIDSIDMNALTGNVSTSPCVETRCIASLQRNTPHFHPRQGRHIGRPDEFELII
jgi:hypothetical protein